VRDQVIFDGALVRRYNVSGPRYTSYPAAPWFRDDFGPEDYAECAEAGADCRALSLYFHLPFCAHLCFYCACNKVVTKNRDHARPYLQHLAREIALQAEFFGARPTIDQLHWGGGTPTFIAIDQLEWLYEEIARAYPLRDDDGGDYSIELDPRTVDVEAIHRLRRLGFNRASLGVQDLNPEVQKAINRVQPESMTRATLDACREAGFRSLNIDLIYGLPLQTMHSFARTLDRVIELGPDRLAVYNYAHLPERFAPQRRIRAEDLPSAEERLAILRHTVMRLTAAGYVYIGMDHFARADDELVAAMHRGTLTRNFQGYSSHGDCDIIAHGISAIGMFGNCYAQHFRDRDAYYSALEDGRMPVARGLRLTPDDQLRRAVITRLMCDFHVDLRAVGAKYGLDAPGLLAPEIEALAPLEADGLVERRGPRVTVTPVGRLLVRNVAMVFDRYLRQNEIPATWSRAI